MKKMVAFLLAAVMLFALAGCGDATESATEATEPATDATTTEDAHAGHDHGTTATAGEESKTTSPLQFDEIISLSMENKVPANARAYRDLSVGTPNYTLKLTALTDLVQVQLIALDPDSGAPASVVSTLSPLKEGESQYLLIYVNDANPTRGIVCTDSHGRKWYYSFMYSGQSGRVFLGSFKAEH